jgi:hypothetical protein
MTEIPKAIVEIRPGVFLHTIWFFERKIPLPLGPPHRSADFLGTLLREGDGPWEYRARIRFHVDHLAHGSADPKSHNELALGTDESYALGFVQGFNDAVRTDFPDDAHIVSIGRDGSDFREILLLLEAIPGFNVKQLTPPTS